MSNHTPGPWHWKGDGFTDEPSHCPHGTDWTDHGPDLVSATGEVVICSTGYDASNVDIKAADARLIAAAPALYDALKFAVSVLSTAGIAGSVYAPVLQQARKALELAEKGEQE